jgi:dihydrolipoamide dehydrogenase
MSKTVDVHIPDIGDFKNVDVIEVLVAPGDVVKAEQSLITLESDKATIEVPSPQAGVVKELKVKVGDKVSQGSPILRLDVEGAADETASPARPPTIQGGEAAVPAAPRVLEPVLQPVSGPGSTPISFPAQEIRTEVVVLGSGPGGYTAAFRAADLGKQVVLIERYPVLGGVCLNVGCIPSKALLHVAKLVEEAAEAQGWGVSLGPPSFDLEKLRSWKDGVVGRLTQGIRQLAKQRKLRVVQGEAKFISPYQIRVEGPEAATVVSFDQAIIAAGSQPVRVPGFPYGDPRLMDSTRALALPDLPRELLIIGGGIIGLELATVYHALGSRVTVVELLDTLIPGCDPDLVRPLQRRIEKRYDKILLKTKVSRLEPREESLVAYFEGGRAPEPKRFDRVLVAVGRRPNGALIGAENAGVQVEPSGFIRVDQQQRTHVPHIFAIGDIVGQPMLAHKASHQGKVAAEVIAGLKSGFDARAIPSVAYTDPEVAWAGVTETEAKARGLNYGKGTFPWAASGRSLTLGRDEGMTKVLFDQDTHRVIGVGIVGSNAGELIAEGVLAIEMGSDARDIGLTIHPHPTLSETVGMAAEAFEGTITDLYLPHKTEAREKG